MTIFGAIMVVDTSAVLAVIFKEPGASWVAAQLNSHEGNLFMSTVNLGETLMLIRNRRQDSVDALEADLLASALRFVPPTIEHARQAAIARHRFPLNLGDCFAYALSLSENCPILTLDADFRRCDRPIVFPPT
jgi:ribonuclease VapC